MTLFLGYEKVDWFIWYTIGFRNWMMLSTVMNICVPWNTESFLTICKLASFSRRQIFGMKICTTFFQIFQRIIGRKSFTQCDNGLLTFMTMRNFSLNMRPHQSFSSCRYFKSAWGKNLQLLSNTRRVYSRTFIMNKEAGSPNETSVTTWEFRFSSLCIWGLRSSGMFAALLGHYYRRLATTCLPRLQRTDI